MNERTLAIIKPDAFAQNVVGQIITMAESRGLSIIGVKLLHLTQEQAENFYHVHRGKEFFHSLTQFEKKNRPIRACSRLAGHHSVKTLW